VCDLADTRVQDRPYWDDVPIQSILEMCKDGSLSAQAALTIKYQVPANRRDLLAAKLITTTHLREFWTMMRTTRSVISGSAALLFWVGLNEFQLGDMDIYTSTQNGYAVAAWFKSILGWLQVSKTENGYKIGKTRASGVERVIRLTDSGVYIDIVVSRGSSALLPIAKFWSTLLFNFVAADGAFCAYPHQMIERKGLISQSQQMDDEEETDRLVKKYKKRLFHNEYTHDDWDRPSRKAMPG
jgi:hypothetical protein